jgi:hypothetical protein
MLRSCTRILAGAFVWPLALSAKTFTTLYTFSSPGGNVQLYGGLILGAGGELYGAASSNDITGEVYELLPPASSGGAWTEVVLHSFTAEDGGPNGSLTVGPSGSLYGIAYLGVSTGGYGVVFQLDPPAGTRTQWSYAVIYQFPRAVPPGALVFGAPRGAFQSLYSAADGVVYRLTPPPTAGGAWTFSALYVLCRHCRVAPCGRRRRHSL